MKYECKTIPGYEDYQVDTNGDVWSFNYNNIGDCRKLKPAIRKGYCRVTLYKNGKKKYFTIHRLVMLSFVGESKLQVNHINGIKDDNRLENLEYCAASENIKHAFKMGLSCKKGENNTQSKLTEKVVIEIKTALLTPYRGINNDLAKKYGVTRYAITDIKIGKTWKHVKIN